MGLVGILIALGSLIWLSYRGWSILILAPAAAIVAAAASGEPLLAHWTQTFMGGAAQFLAQLFFRCSCWEPYSGSSWRTAARLRPSLAS
jgi:H+/gluconate symporter-like permease